MTNYNPERQERWARKERQYAEQRLHEVEGALGIPASDLSNWDSGAIKRRTERLSAIASSRIPESDFHPNYTPLRLGDYRNR